MVTEETNQPDPIMQLIENYRAGLAAYPAALTNDETDATAAELTYSRPMNGLAKGQVFATTREGAAAALHLADEELGDFDSFVTHLIRAAVGYLERQLNDGGISPL